MEGPEPTACESPACGAPIILVLVTNQDGHKPKRMPLNPDPDDGGNVAVRIDAAGTWWGRVIGKSQVLPYETLYCPHFATCKDPAWRRRPQRGNWTSAQNAHNASGRRRRTLPAGPELGPGMTRLYPGRTP